MKTLSIVLASLLVAFGLAACDGKKGDTPGFGKDVPAEAQTPAPAAPASAPDEKKK